MKAASLLTWVCRCELERTFSGRERVGPVDLTGVRTGRRPPQMCVLATPREQRHLKKKIKDINEPITRYSGMEQQAGADFREGDMNLWLLC